MLILIFMHLEVVSVDFDVTKSTAQDQTDDLLTANQTDDLITSSDLF
jgi:hypothetical protein